VVAVSRQWPPPSNASDHAPLQPDAWLHSGALSQSHCPSEGAYESHYTNSALIHDPRARASQLPTYPAEHPVFERPVVPIAKGGSVQPTDYR